MEKRQTVVLGVTGSIAAFKAAQLCSNLRKKALDVHVVMTRNAAELVAPLTFQTLSGNRVSVDTFDTHYEWNVEHISLAKAADVFVVAPATANLIAKAAQGICDDMLTTTLLAARCPKVICPAMNTGMLENPATQHNLEILRSRGFWIVDADAGFLACGDEGKGKLVDYPKIEDAIFYALHREKPLTGRHVLVTAGATRERLDPVRFITNHSTGKMGYAVARAARAMGAQVTLVSANTALPAPYDIRLIRTESAEEMYQAVMDEWGQMQLFVGAAAVADYRPQQVSGQKIKKGEGELVLPLTRTKDILAAVCAAKREDQLACGFSMETENLLENSMGKLRRKGADMIVANSLNTAGAGFGTDTNVASIITADGVDELPLMSKEALAEELLGRLCRMFPGEPG